jgi:hypothetical protein
VSSLAIRSNPTAIGSTARNAAETSPMLRPNNSETSKNINREINVPNNTIGKRRAASSGTSQAARVFWGRAGVLPFLFGRFHLDSATLAVSCGNARSADSEKGFCS